MNPNMTLFPTNAPPRIAVRRSDPITSRLAGAKQRSRKELIAAIRYVVSNCREPLTQFEIADIVVSRWAEKHWQRDTVRAACSRSSLRKLDNKGVSPSGCACARYDGVLRDA